MNKRFIFHSFRALVGMMVFFLIPPPTILKKKIFKKFCHPAFQVSVALLKNYEQTAMEFYGRGPGWYIEELIKFCWQSGSSWMSKLARYVKTWVVLDCILPFSKLRHVSELRLRLFNEGN